MSSIRFQDPHGSATLPGHERPWLFGLIHDQAQRVLTGPAGAEERMHTLYDLLPANHELREVPLGRGISPGRWLAVYARALQDIFDDPIVEYRGHTMRPLTLALNTAMEAGPDPLRLAARLMGQCEINCWVDGPNRGWLADVVDSGLGAGHFRRACGWEDLQYFLRKRDDHPVVVSYSENFPAYWTAPIASADEFLDGEDAEQAWEAMTTREQWDHALRALRGRTTEGLEITPDWAGYRFGATLSLGDLLAQDRVHRLDQAFQLTS
ncbi:hypothetical protein [Streptomyces sp. NBC_01601]|uniref:hypothetical protein n=1 Tax=Streptomyces sp. NBC_01601 TaxID=2975892 RepID=UPI002E27BEDE|nr:hypothetical protein [Streptomyces sp. NBC_01601]